MVQTKPLTICRGVMPLLVRELSEKAGGEIDS